jgi:hypothetical protein
MPGDRPGIIRGSTNRSSVRLSEAQLRDNGITAIADGINRMVGYVNPDNQRRALDELLRGYLSDPDEKGDLMEAIKRGLLVPKALELVLATSDSLAQIGTEAAKVSTAVKAVLKPRA